LNQLPGHRHRPDALEAAPDRPQQAGLQPALNPAQPSLVVIGVVGNDAAEGIVVEGDEALDQPEGLHQSWPELEPCRVEALLKRQPRDLHHIAPVEKGGRNRPEGVAVARYRTSERS
jgi:hypothetical protein